MTKDFNSDMFSAILSANEKAMALLEQQVVDTQKQSKRKDLVYCLIILALSILLGGMVYVCYNNKPIMNVDYGQGITDSELTNSELKYDNKISD